MPCELSYSYAKYIIIASQKDIFQVFADRNKSVVSIFLYHKVIKDGFHKTEEFGSLLIAY